MSTNLVLNVLPRFPAHIRATDGLTMVVENGVDQVIKPDFGALVPVPAVTNPETTYFQAWDKSINYYQSISFQDFADNLADQVLAGTLVALKNVTFAADQGIYFSDANTAHAYSLSSFARGISGSADAAAFRTAVGLWASIGPNGQMLTVAGGVTTWADVGTTVAGAATSDDTIDDTDEILYRTGTAFKRATFAAGLIASIFQAGRTIANATFAGATFRLRNAATAFYLSTAVTALTANRTLTFPDADVDLGRINTLGFKLKQSVAPSGTAIDFTSFSSTVKKVTIVLRAVSLSTAGVLEFRLGTAGGIVATGYVADFVWGNTTLGSTTGTTGAILSPTVTGPFTIVLEIVKAGATAWVITGAGRYSGGGVVWPTAQIDLGAALTQMRLTTSAGTPTFSGTSIDVYTEEA